VETVRVHITRHDVGLALVSFEGGAGPGPVDRIEHVEELDRFVAVPEARGRHDDPDRRVRVLPAVLTDAGYVGPDVARIRFCPVERRSQQQEGLRSAAHEMRAVRYSAVHLAEVFPGRLRGGRV
jgi:hypothetical protein